MDGFDDSAKVGDNIRPLHADIRGGAESGKDGLIDKTELRATQETELVEEPAGLHLRALDEDIPKHLVVINRPLVFIHPAQARGDRTGDLILEVKGPGPAGLAQLLFHFGDSTAELGADAEVIQVFGQVVVVELGQLRRQVAAQVERHPPLLFIKDHAGEAFAVLDFHLLPETHLGELGPDRDFRDVLKNELTGSRGILVRKAADSRGQTRRLKIHCSLLHKDITIIRIPEKRKGDIPGSATQS